MLEIINQRYMEFLFEIDKKPRNISSLAKVGNLTLSVASTLISRWSMEGVVLKEKFEGGKEIIITPTEYGKAQRELLKEINNNHHTNKQRMIKIEKLKITEGGEK
jgi:predicted transcriptional regulator